MILGELKTYLIQRRRADRGNARRPGQPAAGLLGGLAALLIVDNSGGIVGRTGSLAAVGGRAAPGLRLAALQIFPQRRAEPPLAPRLLHGLGTLVHGRQTYADRLPCGRPRALDLARRARLRHLRPCGKERAVPRPHSIVRYRPRPALP